MIPEKVRSRFGLKPGVQFVVLGDKDVVILKVTQAPRIAEFQAIVGQARRVARRAGMRKKDIPRAVRKARAVH